MAIASMLPTIGVLSCALLARAGCAPQPFIPPDDPMVPTADPAPRHAPPGSAATPNPGVVGPRVSRSLGQRGGIVVLYPRVIPSKLEADVRSAARTVQGRLHGYAVRALPNRPADVRPEPERVCPRATGCLGVTVGTLIVTNGVGCAVVATISGPGRAPQRLVKWAGDVTIWKPAIPFRDPPEGAVTVRDFARCSELPTLLDHHEAELITAIRSVAGP